MKILKLLWSFLKFRFTTPFTRDQHFNKALRSLFVLGFYQKFTRTRALLSFLMTIVIFGSIFFGCLKKFYESWHANDILSSVISAILLLRHSIIFSELLSFYAKKAKIKKMIRNFHEFQDMTQESECDKLCGESIQRVRRVFTAVVPIIVLYNAVIIGENNFVVPVIYGPAESINSFPFSYLIYIIHALVFAQGVASIELLPIISVLKLEGLVASLCQKMKQVTSENFHENEKKLDSCIKFHVEILK
jgi:hypothetical protein